MPSAIIEVRHTYSPDDETGILGAVHEALVESFKVNPAYRNVTLVVHAAHRFLGRTDCPDPERLTNITLFVLRGRSVQAKRNLYQGIVTRLEAFGIPRVCVLIRLNEMDAENFGVRGGIPICDIDLDYPVDV